jgi:hypothetical protein
METAAQTMRKRMEYKMWEMSDNLKKVSKMQVFHLDAWWRLYYIIVLKACRANNLFIMGTRRSKINLLHPAALLTPLSSSSRLQSEERLSTSICTHLEHCFSAWKHLPPNAGKHLHLKKVL